MTRIKGVLGVVLLAACFAATAGESPERHPVEQAEPVPAEQGKEPAQEGGIPAQFVKDGKPDLEAIVKHFEDMYRADSSTSRAELTVTKPRRTRTIKMKVWTRGTEKALILITSPAREKGIATLKFDTNLWNYLPRIKRTIRIPPSMMLGSWMGSDFTNDDLVKEASMSEEYTYQLVGHSEKPLGWRVRFDARPGVVGLWKRIDLVVSEDGRIPLEAYYYDRKGRLARTITWDEGRDFGKKRIPARMTLVPHDKKKKGHKTEMRYLDIKFDVDVPASTFSLSRLERSR